MVFIGFLLISLAGFFNGVSDTLIFHYEKSIFIEFKNQSFWNPTISWENKYKNGDPFSGERFIFSTTLLVSLTDALHLSKTLTLLLIFISIPIISLAGPHIQITILNLFISRVLFGVGFILAYNHVLLKK